MVPIPFWIGIIFYYLSIALLPYWIRLLYLANCCCLLALLWDHVLFHTTVDHVHLYCNMWIYVSHVILDLEQLSIIPPPNLHQFAWSTNNKLKLCNTLSLWWRHSFEKSGRPIHNKPLLCWSLPFWNPINIYFSSINTLMYTNRLLSISCPYIFPSFVLNDWHLQIIL